MKIYHYTNIETLALILKNRTIRFNRADLVDDLEEGMIESHGINFGKYTFKSCWTENQEESIPLWKMYTNGVSGIRIGLEKKAMFKRYIIPEKNPYGITSFGGPSICDYPPEQMYGQNQYTLPPIYNSNYEECNGFYRKIKYVDDVNEQMKGFMQTSLGDGTHRGSTFISYGEIGSYKHSRWAFEDESRFVLNIFPGNFMIRPSSADPMENIKRMLLSLKSNQDLPFRYYDKELRDDIFDEMEITLSPMATLSQKIIVEALCDKYAPNAVIKSSDLASKVKLK